MGSEDSPPAAQFKDHDRLTVLRDGEEIEVFNWVNIRQEVKTVVRGAGHVEHFDEDPEIGAGDSPESPDYVTSWVADQVQYEHDFWIGNIDGIDVVNVEAEGVEVL